MVTRNIILKSLDDAISKCGPTIKQRFENFNPKDFSKEKYSSDQDVKGDRSPIGEIQRRQGDAQKDIDYTITDKMVSSLYQFHLFNDLNSYLNKVTFEDMFGNKHRVGEYDIEFISKFSDDHSEYLGMEMVKTPVTYGLMIDDVLTEKTIPELGDMLSEAIDKSPRLLEPTLLYRFGHFEKGMKAGDTGKFDAFLSATFNEYVARKGIKNMNYLKLAESRKSRYQMRIYAPKGTKGMVLNRYNGCDDFQSEFLIDKGQKYIVLNVNDKKKTVDILLY